MMTDKKYQVFVSSTYADLKEERRKILDVLLMADCIPAGMEAFVASDTEQFEVIKKVIELCDYYVLIIGKRYGSINSSTGLSYTEMEYEYAKGLGIPVLVFALDESVTLPEDKTETDEERIAALASFRKKALTNRLATIWKTQEELVGTVAVSIMRAIKEIQRPGWQRATEYDEASLRREIMDLQTKNSKTIAELNTVRKELMALKAETELAFEDYKVRIDYTRHITGYAPTHGRIDRTFTELFRIVSTEMMDVALTEKAISDCLRMILFKEDSYLYSFTNPQFVKVLLNQFKALGLIYSKWSNDKSNLYWGLTTKGEIERNKMILVPKTNVDG